MALTKSTVNSLMSRKPFLKMVLNKGEEADRVLVAEMITGAMVVRRYFSFLIFVVS